MDEFDTIAMAAVEAATSLRTFDLDQLEAGRLTPGVTALQSELQALRALAGVEEEPTGLSWLQQINRDPDITSVGRRVASWLARHGDGEHRIARIASDLGSRAKAVQSGLTNLLEHGYTDERPSIRMGCVRVKMLG